MGTQNSNSNAELQHEPVVGVGICVVFTVPLVGGGDTDGRVANRTLVGKEREEILSTCLYSKQRGIHIHVHVFSKSSV